MRGEIRFYRPAERPCGRVVRGGGGGAVEMAAVRTQGGRGEREASGAG